MFGVKTCERHIFLMQTRWLVLCSRMRHSRKWEESNKTQKIEPYWVHLFFFFPSNRGGEQENPPEDYLNKKLGRQEESGKKKKTTYWSKRNMSFSKVCAHLCASPRQAVWQGEEGKLHTPGGAWRGTKGECAGAGGADWCELSKRKPACLVIEKSQSILRS